MPITMQEIFDKAMALMDNYTEDGSRVPTADTIDLQAKSILFADMAQKELYNVARIEKTFNFSQKPFVNLLGHVSNFDQVDFVGTDQVYPVSGGVVGAKAYYFESTGIGNAFVEEFNGTSWAILSTIAMPLGTSYLAYKGVITPTNANYPIRLRFSGTTWFRHVNRCLFKEPFAVSQIPEYRPWVKMALPSDFMDVTQIVTEFSERQYAKDSMYKWEEPNNLYINYYYDSNYRLIYRPIPVTVSLITDILECNAVIGQAIVYYVAAKLAPYENQSLVNFFEGKYNELKIQSQSPTPLTWEKVQPKYSLNSGW